MGTHHDRSLSSRYKNGSKHIELAPQRHRQNVLPPSADAKREQEPERGNMPRTGAARHRKLYPRTPRAILCRQTGHLPATPQHHREAGDRQKCIGHHRHVVIVDVKAKLKSTNMTIQEIAYSLNFPSASFFGKYFKRHMGMSPLEYRNS